MDGARLRAVGFDGYGGGILLFVGLAAVSLGLVSVCSLAVAASLALAWLIHAFLLYSLLALGDLLHHVWRIEQAVRAGDLPRARLGVSALVGPRHRAHGRRRLPARGGREPEREPHRRLCESCFLVCAWRLPGIVVFKVVSTMDSMVGYKTPRYLRFGWCGARLDDVMNYVPARLTWLIIAALAAVLPGYSARKAWTVGLRQHALLLGPNSGWSEAAAAGALERQIVGPIWLKGVQVTDLWIGDPSDPPLATSADMTRALVLVVSSGLVIAAAASAVLLRWNWKWRPPACRLRPRALLVRVYELLVRIVTQKVMRFGRRVRDIPEDKTER